MKNVSSFAFQNQFDRFGRSFLYEISPAGFQYNVRIEGATEEITFVKIYGFHENIVIRITLSV